MSNKYFIETYGCQMNVADSELVSSQLEKIGYVNRDKKVSFKYSWHYI